MRKSVFFIRKNVRITELSERLGTTIQNMANKFKRINFSMNEFEAIAKVLDFMFEVSFVDKNGEKIYKVGDTNG